MSLSNPPPLSRRRFLKSTAALAAATTLPDWFLDESEARAATTRPLSPNDQPAIARLWRTGRGVAREASRFGRVVAVCDVDDSQIAQAKKQWPDLGANLELDTSRPNGLIYRPESCRCVAPS